MISTLIAGTGDLIAMSSFQSSGGIPVCQLYKGQKKKLISFMASEASTCSTLNILFLKFRIQIIYPPTAAHTALTISYYLKFLHLIAPAHPPYKHSAVDVLGGFYKSEIQQLS